MTKHVLLIISRVATILAAVILVVGIIVAWKQFQENKTTKQDVPTEAATGAPFADDTAPPSTNEPDKSEFESYTVAADAPRYIFISKISVEAIVKPLGLDKKGRIAAPANVHHVGWFTESSKPGQPGAMVVDGHLSSWKTRGIFYDLKELKTGDIIIIERGDGQKIEYKVAKTQVYDANTVDMDAVLKPINAANPGLNLITCAGKVIKGTNDFDKRLVIFAEQT